MPEGARHAKPTKLFVGCFSFSPDPDLAPPGDEEGTFQLLVKARDEQEAASKCRARLRAIATTTNSLGPVLVYAFSLIEVAPADLIDGLIVNHQAIGREVSYCFLPAQGEVASVEHSLDDPEDGGPEADDLDELAALMAPGEAEDARDDEDPDDDEPLVPVFWGNWKLYWCETPDHDEDAFVVALSGEEAAAFHEDAEGYDEGEADAEFVCVLPDALQPEADREQGGWPSERVLLACGAEFLTYVPRTPDTELREQLGARARVVRINGRVYSEGDLVSNVRHRLGAEPDA